MRVATRSLPPLLIRAGVTRREADVLEALALRLPNREIAERLVLSVRTVESHVSSLLAKLQAADRNELATIAQTVVVGPATSGRLPLSLLELTERGSLIGRRREMAQLRQLWTEAAAGRSRAALLLGEAGIGKSRLLAELALVADRQGGLVVVGNCDEEPLAPFQAVLEAVSAVVAAMSPDSLAEARRQVGPELASVVPLLAPVAKTSIGGTPAQKPLPRYRLFDQLADVVLVASRDTPLLLAFEDLQWASAPVLQFIRHLARRADRTRLLLIGTVRGTQMDDARRHLADELRRGAGARFFTLAGLGVAEVAELIADRAPAGPGDAAERYANLAEHLHAETAGNPFFVDELVEHLLSLPQGLSGAIRGAGVPATVRELILHRTNSLAAPTRELLAAAAVLGWRFRVDHLARAAQIGTDELTAALDEAQAAGLLSAVSERPGWMEFSHALVRETLEAELPAGQRQRLHRRVADILEADGPEGHLAELAHHLHAAALPEDHARIVAYAADAAQEASRRLAHELAADLYQKALDAMELAPTADDARRFQILLLQSHAHQRAGRQDAAMRSAAVAFALAQRLDDPVRLADAALAMAASAPTWPDDPQLVRALKTALAGISKQDLRRRALLMARLDQAEYYRSPGGQRDSFGGQAVELARAASDRATLAAVLSARHALLWGPTATEERLSIAAEIVTLAEGLGDDELALQGYAWLVIDRLEKGDVAAVDEAIRSHAALARRLGEPLHIRDTALWMFTRTVLDGSFEEAERQSRHALLLGQRVADAHAEMFRAIQRFWLMLERGGPRHELAEVMAETANLADRYPHVPAWRAKRALLSARAGDRDAASAFFAQLSARHFAALPRDAVWIGGLYYLAEVAAFLGDRPQAGVLYDLLLPYATRVVVIDRGLVCLGSVSRALGLLAQVLGNRAAADRHLRQALAMHAAMGARPLTARSRFEMGCLLRGTDDEPRGLEQLALARATAAELGMEGLVAQIDGVAR